ncbi:hypothetical protein GMRT_11046 [Giardia muris]|uniref:Uncharacterized protein n=1 Tax=Giardia muris TaxID=5742 RepID=A0A4Z1SN71_GIAMU|nr:hypothetical protein GMRT_11046 [Giardia muris]|eukprot:TNJ27166.1 hypothetical protein GMRT_11046 [Giardia muris]
MQSEDVPYLVFNYFRECGYLHSAAALACEARLDIRDSTLERLRPDLLRLLLARGLAHSDLEQLLLGVKNEDKVEKEERDGEEKPGPTSPSAQARLQQRWRQRPVSLTKYTVTKQLAGVDPSDVRILVLPTEPSSSVTECVLFLYSTGVMSIELPSRQVIGELEMGLTRTKDLAIISPDGQSVALTTDTGRVYLLHSQSLSVLYDTQLRGIPTSVSFSTEWTLSFCLEDGSAVLLSRPIASRSKLQADLTIPALHPYIQEKYGGIHWDFCVFQRTPLGSAMDTSSYFYCIGDEFLALASSQGMVQVTVPSPHVPTDVFPVYFDVTRLLERISDAPLQILALLFCVSKPDLVCLTNHGLVFLPVKPDSGEYWTILGQPGSPYVEVLAIGGRLYLSCQLDGNLVLISIPTGTIALQLPLPNQTLRAVASLDQGLTETPSLLVHFDSQVMLIRLFSDMSTKESTRLNVTETKVLLDTATGVMSSAAGCAYALTQGLDLVRLACTGAHVE